MQWFVINITLSACTQLTWNHNKTFLRHLLHGEGKGTVIRFTTCFYQCTHLILKSAFPCVYRFMLVCIDI